MDGRIIAASAVAAALAGWYWLLRRPAKRPLVTHGSRLLFVGDSMLEGLEPHLRGKASKAGVSYLGMWKRGARISTWSRSPPLRDALVGHAPDACVIVLGTNDAALADPAAQRGELRSLLLTCSDATGSPVAWIDPPRTPFPGDAAVRSMLEEALLDLPLRRLDTASLVLARSGDGIHLTQAGYGRWADVIWKWLEDWHVD